MLSGFASAAAATAATAAAADANFAATAGVGVLCPWTYCHRSIWDLP